MQFVTVLHDVFFNAILIFSGIIGAWAIGTGARNRDISGGFWGAVATLSGLSAVTLLVGVILASQGYTPADGRTNIYFIYMGWLLVIIPGMFTQLRGRDDSAAAIAFAMIALFNLFVGLSMRSRGLVGPWVLPS